MRAGTSGWAGCALVTDSMLVYFGAVGRTDLHAHHAVQVMVGRDESVSLSDDQGRKMRGRAVIVPSDAPHVIHEGAEGVFVLFIDPDGYTGRRLHALAAGADMASWFHAARTIVTDPSAPDVLQPSTLEHLAALVVRDLLGAAPPAPDHHRAVSALLAILPGRLDSDVRLHVLASEVALSASRLGHLFSEQVGIPVRRYILWLRLQRAVTAMIAGDSWTTAAHHAGFSDGAHMSNTFRRMFGVAPSEISGGVRWFTRTALNSQIIQVPRERGE